MSAAQESVSSPVQQIGRERLHHALTKARAALLAERGPSGHWEGELSSSALSTATAVTALELWQRHASPASQSAIGNRQTAIQAGLRWLAEHQNADGGWGDTTLSFSNISTTALCWAAFGGVPGAEQRCPETVRRAEAWLEKACAQCSVFSNQSSAPKASADATPTENCSLNADYPSKPLDRDRLADAIIARYGKDRTFSVPILTMCALAGRLGEGKAAWRKVIQLPFELAALPQKFFAALKLPVVSYALPALIAIGQVRHHHRPTRNPLTRLLRDRARAKTLRVLERIQPPNGGFLEATPLTSFVTMSLAGCGNANHPVALRGVEFLLKSMRTDGSWPIDTNLATWVTTLAVNALGPSIHEVMSAEERGRILDWLLAQQYRTVHPYTGAAPGGWSWTDLPGGVPDADDTAGALLALKQLNDGSPRVREAAIAGVKWLLDLQNRDGGIPTFCCGWTNLPFDRSSPDITAHALRAWLAWLDEIPPRLRERILEGSSQSEIFLLWKGLGLRHRSFRLTRGSLASSWVPLWFGNQHHPQEENPTYGTSRVLLALGSFLSTFEAKLANSGSSMRRLQENTRKELLVSGCIECGLTDLTLGQQLGGEWSGACGQSADLSAPASVEETALAVEALANAVGAATDQDPHFADSLNRGTDWLLARVEDGTWTQPAPIGFYFAKLWYYERLYPMVFTVAALEAVARLERNQSDRDRDNDGAALGG